MTNWQTNKQVISPEPFSYLFFITLAKAKGWRIGYGRDAITGAIGLFLEEPVYLFKSGKYSRKRRHPVLMRATGRMQRASTVINWK